MTKWMTQIFPDKQPIKMRDYLGYKMDGTDFLDKKPAQFCTKRLLKNTIREMSAKSFHL
jgi:hypothetical protein